MISIPPESAERSAKFSKERKPIKPQIAAATMTNVRDFAFRAAF
jgi:hypothetical protein